MWKIAERLKMEQIMFYKASPEKAIELFEYQPEAKDDSHKEDEEDNLLGELVAEEGGRGKVKEAQGKAKEGKAAQKVAPDMTIHVNALLWLQQKLYFCDLTRCCQFQNEGPRCFGNTRCSSCNSMRKECHGADFNFASSHFFCKPKSEYLLLIRQGISKSLIKQKTNLDKKKS